MAFLVALAGSALSAVGGSAAAGALTTAGTAIAEGVASLGTSVGNAVGIGTGTATPTPPLAAAGGQGLGIAGPTQPAIAGASTPVSPAANPNIVGPKPSTFAGDFGTLEAVGADTSLSQTGTFADFADTERILGQPPTGAPGNVGPTAATLTKDIGAAATKIGKGAKDFGKGIGDKLTGRFKDQFKRAGTAFEDFGTNFKDDPVGALLDLNKELSGVGTTEGGSRRAAPQQQLPPQQPVPVGSSPIIGGQTPQGLQGQNKLTSLLSRIRTDSLDEEFKRLIGSLKIAA